MFYAVPTARVVLTAKTSLDVFSLRRDHVWTCSVLGDRICEMKRVTESGQQGIKILDHFSCTMISRGYQGPILPHGQQALPGPQYDVYCKGGYICGCMNFREFAKIDYFAWIYIRVFTILLLHGIIKIIFMTVIHIFADISKT